MEGLSSADNIQGAPADMLIEILKAKSIPIVLKWVDDFVLFHTPKLSESHSLIDLQYSYDITTILSITDLLGIPWHPIKAKGQDFHSTVSYVGFIWSLDSHSISLSCKKSIKYLAKVTAFLSNASGKVS